MDMLLVHPNVAWAYITSTGTFKGLKGGKVVIGFPGLSDILGMTKSGKLFAIEVKLPNGKTTKEQIEFIDLVKNNNGIAGIARDIEQAKKLID